MAIEKSDEGETRWWGDGRVGETRRGGKDRRPRVGGGWQSSAIGSQVTCRADESEMVEMFDGWISMEDGRRKVSGTIEEGARVKGMELLGFALKGRGLDKS
ncbi:hypothetical protein EDB86DRAFT_2828126 [Lactarius hatsudake]|nr:hypothetical protein EDB86DRAFT_2828126 [Lactarius hatsudake]